MVQTKMEEANDNVLATDQEQEKEEINFIDSLQQQYDALNKNTLLHLDLDNNSEITQVMETPLGWITVKYVDEEISSDGKRLQPKSEENLKKLRIIPWQGQDSKDLFKDLAGNYFKRVPGNVEEYVDQTTKQRNAIIEFFDKNGTSFHKFRVPNPCILRPNHRNYENEGIFLYKGQNDQIFFFYNMSEDEVRANFKFPEHEINKNEKQSRSIFLAVFNPQSLADIQFQKSNQVHDNLDYVVEILDKDIENQIAKAGFKYPTLVKVKDQTYFSYHVKDDAGISSVIFKPIYT